MQWNIEYAIFANAVVISLKYGLHNSKKHESNVIKGLANKTWATFHLRESINLSDILIELARMNNPKQRITQQEYNESIRIMNVMNLTCTSYCVGSSFIYFTKLINVHSFHVFCVDIEAYLLAGVANCLCTQGGLFWCILTELWSNTGNKQQNKTRVST